MENCITVVGLDVHKDSIVAAVLPPDASRPTQTLQIENQPKSIDRLLRGLAASGPAEFVYEAGPCGFELQRHLTHLGQRCVVIAPSLIPKCPGDRVKTDRARKRTEELGAAMGPSVTFLDDLTRPGAPSL